MDLLERPYPLRWGFTAQRSARGPGISHRRPARHPGDRTALPCPGETDQSPPQLQRSAGRGARHRSAQQVAPDYSIIQPDISATINGTRVDVGWDWGGFANFLDQLELEVDRGQGFVLLAIDTTPGYTDSQPFPAAPVKWTYRAIYRLGDNRVGQWSKPVSITVGG
jgi:hypothetical protein